MRIVSAFIDSNLRFISLQTTRNWVHVYLSLGTVTLMSIAFTSFSVSFSLLQYLVSLIFGGSVSYCRISRNKIKTHQYEISGVVGSLVACISGGNQF